MLEAAEVTIDRGGKGAGRPSTATKRIEEMLVQDHRVGRDNCSRLRPLIRKFGVAGQSRLVSWASSVALDRPVC